jgi:hypothetical protein
MRKLFVTAALVAACSFANAAEVKKDTNSMAPTVKAQKMNDKDMDNVTAGLGAGAQNGASSYGLGVATGAIANPGYSGTSHPTGNRP